MDRKSLSAKQKNEMLCVHLPRVIAGRAVCRDQGMTRRNGQLTFKQEEHMDRNGKSNASLVQTAYSKEEVLS